MAIIGYQLEKEKIETQDPRTTVAGKGETRRGAFRGSRKEGSGEREFSALELAGASRQPRKNGGQNIASALRPLPRASNLANRARIFQQLLRCLLISKPGLTPCG